MRNREEIHEIKSERILKLINKKSWFIEERRTTTTKKKK